jgi:hypothetical protein
VALVRTDVSEKRIASIRVTGIAILITLKMEAIPGRTLFPRDVHPRAVNFQVYMTAHLIDRKSIICPLYSVEFDASNDLM